MFENTYPYTDFHEMNLDWIIAKVKELDKKLGEDLEAYIQQYIDEHLSQLILNAEYDAVTETITLSIATP